MIKKEKHQCPAIYFGAPVLTTTRAKINRALAPGGDNLTEKSACAPQVWPAHLEWILPARGYDVVVSVYAADKQVSGPALEGAISGMQAGAAIIICAKYGSSNRRRSLISNRIYTDMIGISCSKASGHGAMHG